MEDEIILSGYIIGKGKKSLKILWLNSYWGGEFVAPEDALVKKDSFHVLYNTPEMAQKILNQLPKLRKFEKAEVKFIALTMRIHSV